MTCYNRWCSKKSKKEVLKPFTYCVNLGKSLHLSELQFSHLQNGANNTSPDILIRFLWGTNKIRNGKLQSFGNKCYPPSTPSFEAPNQPDKYIMVFFMFR